MKVNQEISIKELMLILWKDKLLIFSVVLFFAISSVLFSLFLPNKYQSSILIMPAEQTSFNSNIKAVGGLASLAGVTLPKENNKSALYLEILKSRSFLNNFIISNKLLVPLMASRGWDQETNTLLLDDNIYNKNKKKWTRKASTKIATIPSLYEARKLWYEDIFTYNENKRTGFITINITHYSPYLAQSWASELIKDLNNHIREIDVTKANLAIDYLNKEAENTNSEYLKSVFFDLIKTETEKKMLAFSQDEYAYRIIDQANLPEKKLSPNRAFICISITLFGLVFAVFICLCRFFIPKIKEN